jgi:hypothetical protein
MTSQIKATSLDVVVRTATGKKEITLKVGDTFTEPTDPKHPLYVRGAPRGPQTITGFAPRSYKNRVITDSGLNIADSVAKLMLEARVQ